MQKKKQTQSGVKVITSMKNQTVKKKKGTGGCGCGGSK